ncbi:MAG: metal-dependent hydrolase [Ignisphaera sp.]
MKRKTHDILGLAIGLWVSKVFPITNSFLANFLSVIAMSVFINRVIDGFGGHRGFRRTPYTHSLFGLLLISIAAILLLYCFAYLLGFGTFIHLLQNMFAVLFSIGFAHLLADLMTADGVYLFWPFTKKRVSATRRRYDDVLLNGLAIFFSLMIILLYLYVELRPWL